MSNGNGYLLEAKELTKIYGSVIALNNVDFELKKGEIVEMNINKENIPVKKVTFRTIKDLTSVTLTVTMLDNLSNTSEYTYQYFKIETEGFVDSDINEVKIDFGINNSWFRGNNYNMDRVKLQRFSNKTWEPIRVFGDIFSHSIVGDLCEFSRHNRISQNFQWGVG